MNVPQQLKRLPVHLGTIIILLTLNTKSVFAQSQISSFIQAAQGDGNKLLQAYANPFLTRHAEGWSDGWIYTAAHEKFTFKLVSVSATFVGTQDQTFDASTLGLSQSVRITGSPINQTFGGGSNTNNAGFDVYGKNIITGQYQKVASFAGPDGLKLKVLGQSAVPTVVTPQVGFGLFENTEVMVRLMPDVHFGHNTQVTVIGLGGKQGLTDIIFGKSDKSSSSQAPIDIAAYAGYSMENLDYKLDIQPTAADKANSGNQSTDYSNQKVHMHSTDFTVGGIVSKKFWIVTPHAGLAFSSSKTSFAALGTYPVTIVGPAGLDAVSNVQDPFLVSGNYTGPSANIGVNLNLYLIKINTDYVLAKYSRLNVALSLFF